MNAYVVAKSLADQPIWLTDGCCENCSMMDRKDFAELGLESGESNDTFYPLTEREASYIKEDTVFASDIGFVRMSYTALYRVQKYVSPCYEVHFGDGYSPLNTPGDALALIAAERARLLPLMDAVGGLIHVVPDVTPGESESWGELTLLFPYEWVMQRFATYQDWRTWLDLQFRTYQPNGDGEVVDE